MSPSYFVILLFINSSLVINLDENVSKNITEERIDKYPKSVDDVYEEHVGKYRNIIIILFCIFLIIFILVDKIFGSSYLVLGCLVLLFLASLSLKRCFIGLSYLIKKITEKKDLELINLV